ncbi:hypothetical protein AVEN_81498-1 [Araneus ventricosus]|uniref:Uncharacterized protein n=1 Tax=Araneus ventricosus TaxID=182803 RepID=A0A4Y2E4F2_ARAVE|nr:hypothetical protein AVEN_81498-1 [Araneus ventricosus]
MAISDVATEQKGVYDEMGDGGQSWEGNIQTKYQYVSTFPFLCPPNVPCGRKPFSFLQFCPPFPLKCYGRGKDALPCRRSFIDCCELHPLLCLKASARAPGPKNETSFLLLAVKFLCPMKVLSEGSFQVRSVT